MDKNEIEKLKFDLVNKHWTEELHLGLQEIDEEDARAIVESMDDDDINYKVNARRYQEDYIADYLEFLWEISEISFWKHVKATFDENVGLLWSDNMFYFEMLCHERIPSDVLSKIISYVGSCDDEEKQDLELLGCIIKEQVENFGRLPEIKNLISSLAEKQRYIAKKRTNEMINQQCNYL
jgi:hypothetical protein